MRCSMRVVCSSAHFTNLPVVSDEFRMIHASSAARGFRVSDDLEEAIEVKAIRAPPTSLDWRQQSEGDNMMPLEGLTCMQTL